MKLCFLLMVSVFLQSQHGFAQQAATQSVAGYPIEIIDLQPRYLLGNDVVIKGTAIAPQNAGDRLTVTIVAPDGSQRTIYVVPDGNGDFIIRLPGISPEGRFKLSITGFGKAQTKQIEFEAVKVSDAIGSSSSRIESLARNSSELIANIDRHVAARPQDSETAIVRQQLQRLATEHRRVVERTTRARAALGHLATALSSEPRAQAAASEGLTELSNWTNEASRADDELKRLVERTRNMPTKCDSLDTAAEALSFLSSVMNFVGGPTQILKNLAVDKVNPAIMSQRTDANENARFAATEAVKESAAAFEGIDTLKTSVIGLSGDVSQLIVGKLFANYCSVLEGTVSSDFSVDHKAGGLSWWKYRVVLQGKFRLWAEKDQPALPEGIVYTGKLEGNTTKLEFFEDIFRVEQPPNGRIFLRKRISPPVVGNTANDPFGFGQIARRVTPGHFNIRYKGQLKDDKMALRQESVLDDFTALYMNRSVIGVVPPGGLVPVIRTFNFPIQKASWIIDRTTKSELILPVQRQNGKLILKETFTRNETLTDGVSKVTFMVEYSLSS